MTKDCRTLKQYIAHFRKYGTMLNYEDSCSLDVYGIVVKEKDSSFSFVKLLNKGEEVYMVGTKEKM